MPFVEETVSAVTIEMVVSVSSYLLECPLDICTINLIGVQYTSRGEIALSHHVLPATSTALLTVQRW